MVGTQIGNFKLVSLLGSGGMGDVYLAEHVGVQTQVAVKLLRSEIGAAAVAVGGVLYLLGWREARAGESPPISVTAERDRGTVTWSGTWSGTW